MGRDVFSPPFDENEYKAQNFGEVPEFESPYSVDGSASEELKRAEPARREVPFGFIAPLPPEIQYSPVEIARRRVIEAIDKNPPRHPDIYTRQ